MVEETMEVRVVRLRESLLKVVHAHGYQIVLCGRLLLEDVGGRKTPHPDMPAYTRADFPEPFGEWSDAKPGTTSTKVTGITGATNKERDIWPVRASVLLFNPLPRDVAKAWLARRART